MKNAVGVLGGVGPLATVYFMEMVIKMTEAVKDQQHINMLVSNHATIPDRTNFIMGKSNESPVDYMVEDARMLEAAGCNFIVIPCNTAHYFFEDIEKVVDVPVINIIKETINYAVKQAEQRKPSRTVKKLGILATEGIISSRTYNFYGNLMGVECEAPDKEYQDKVNELIYGCVKAGLDVTLDNIMDVVNHMREKGCDAIIMGCTELSVIYKDLDLENICDDIIDSLLVLAMCTISGSGKNIK